MTMDTDAGVLAGSIDLCISSGAVNLSPRLDLLLASAYRALREGGKAAEQLNPNLAWFVG